jgi:16S rRNA (uracil1498-N3)-methyltransferase
VTSAQFLVDALPPGDTFELRGPEGHHAADVQRVRVGETLWLGDGAGSTASAEVVGVGKGTVRLSLVKRWFAETPSPRLVVVQGIPKGDRGELAVQAMTEVGVDEIVPWAAGRCVTVWKGERGTKARSKWEATAREAAKQSRRAWLPTVSPHAMTLKQLVTRVTPGRALVLHESASEPLTGVELPTDGDITLVVGPEGGITDDEIGTLTSFGAVPVRLGETILRTSTAGVAALSVLSARLHRW